MRRIMAVAVGLILLVVLAILYVAYPRHGVPTSNELSDEKLIAATKELKEVKSFLAKYPNALVQVDRSGTLAVDYRVTKASQEKDLAVQPYLRLRILMNSQGVPTEIFIECWNGQTSDIQRDNIPGYLENETCLL